MSFSARQVVHHYAENQRMAESIVQTWTALEEAVKLARTEVSTQYDRARAELSAAYLLDLTPESLQRSEQLTGFRGFTRRDPLKALAHEEHVLKKTIARIMAEERWQRRQYLVGPEGELIRELAEAKSMLEPWQHECSKFEDLVGFNELYTIKYDTPEWSEFWYQPKYWKHWAAGDRICKQLNQPDFGDDVLPAYEKVKAPRDQWLGEVAKVDAKIDAVHKLVQTRDSAEQRIPMLPDLYLMQAQEQLSQFFVNADLGLLEEWLEQAGGDRGVQQVLRRCAGLHAKQTFLTEMLDNGIKEQIAEFNRRAAKYDRKSTKFRRSKYSSRTFYDGDLDTKFRAKFSKYETQPAKLAKQVERLMSYDDYGTFDLNNDPELWYVTFTKKRPSRFTPRLRNWYDRNPDAAPLLEQDDVGEAVATAAASFEQHDTGYLS
jgi:hypothetical protein